LSLIRTMETMTVLGFFTGGPTSAITTPCFLNVSVQLPIIEGGTPQALPLLVGHGHMAASNTPDTNPPPLPAVIGGFYPVSISPTSVLTLEATVISWATTPSVALEFTVQYKVAGP
jgi:hypothetical protein